MTAELLKIIGADIPPHFMYCPLDMGISIHGSDPQKTGRRKAERVLPLLLTYIRYILLEKAGITRAKCDILHPLTKSIPQYMGM